MVPDVKFCGLTRPDDVAMAAALGARYVGVIFAGGPRLLTPERAAAVLSVAPACVRRVGVFGGATGDEVAAVAGTAGLHVAQLHADPGPADIAAIRGQFGGEIWAVVRTADASLPPGLTALFAEADAVILDAKVPGSLGGSGVRLPWHALASSLTAARRAGGAARLVLAGGLTPENVAEAAAAIDPDVVDVSSGVESTVGIKDHARMRAFVDALGAANTASLSPLAPASVRGAEDSRSSTG